MSEPLEDSFDLKDFLEEAELEQYYALFRDILKVRKVSQLKFVDGKDLTQIGLSKPEQRQYKKVYDKYFPNICVMKLRKILRPYKKNANLPRTCKQSTDQLPFDRSSSGVSIKHIIPMNDLIISNELGAGEFGIVQQGTWTTGCENVQVAIKCLGPERMASDSGDFWKEAAVMHNVDHPNIIRLYGVVLNMDSLMLVTELAPYRSLLLCLRESTSRTDFPVATLCSFAEQICDGMTYLESKRLLHRDLATRNILVFSRYKVKISDFGLSRALAIDKDYYQTKYNVNLKLPIAWCAPECVLYLRFTSGSDVWAYGVCLWEMFSYGCQPWAGFSANKILQSIDVPSLQRLQRPLYCPVAYYNIMLKCWEHDTNARPKFRDIGPKLRQIYPQQVQALLNYSNVDSRRHNLLEYTAGDIITVIGKDELWYGVANNGRSGYFHPLNTTPYNIPKVASFSHHDSASTPECLSSLTGESSKPSLSRSDLKRHTYTGKRTVQRSMISSPQGFVKHTGHIGLDGACFGDISFLDPAICVKPKYVARSYRPEDLEHVPLINSNSKSRMTCGASSCASYPTLQDGARPTNYKCTGAIPKNSGTVGSGKSGKKKSSTAPTATKSLLERVKSATFGTSFTSSTESWPSTSMMEEEHHYEEIIEKCDGDLKECTMEDIETVFGGLDIAGRRSNSLFNKSFPQHDVPTRAQTLCKTEKKKILNTSTMKPMSAHDEKTLDTAVALANELTARSMTDLEINSHKQRNSPSDRSKFNFKFPGRLGSLGHSHEPQKCAAAKQGRKNFSEQAKGVPDIQATLTEESKFAYTSLIEEPAFSRMQEDLGANDFPQQNSFQNKHLRSRRVTHPVTHHSNSESISRSTTAHKRTNEHCGPEQANVVPLPPRSAETRLVDKPRHTRKYPLVFPSTSHQYPSVNERSVVPCNSYEKPIVKSQKSPRIYQNLNTSQRFEEVQMLDRPCSRKFYQNIDIIRSVDVMDGPPALEKLPSKSKHKTDKSGDICSNNPFTNVCQTKARSANPFTPPEEEASSSSFNDEKNASRKSSSSNLQEFDHVSVEDLLEFANLKPCGRQRGIESDEVRIMRKVLKEEVTPEACLQALDLTDWDVHKAIKMLMSPPRSST